MPNLWGASPVDHEEGGRSYAAQTFSRKWPSRRRRGCGIVAARGSRSDNMLYLHHKT